MSDAAQAFEQLRAEVTVMRRTVEELRTAVEAVPTVDYALTLGEIAADIDAIAEATGGLSYAERVMQELVQARDTAMRPAITQLMTAQNSAMGVAQAVRNAFDFVRTEQEQRRALKWAFGIGVVAGLLLFPSIVGPIIGKVAGLQADDPAPIEQPAKAR